MARSQAPETALVARPERSTSLETTRQPRRLSVHPALLLGIALFALDVSTLAPSVLRSDSGEFQVMPWVLGIAHAPGYPLLTLLGRIAMLVPIGDPAYRVNLLDAAAAAGAAACAYLAVLELLRDVGARGTTTPAGRLAAHVASAVAGLSLGLGATYWQQSVVGGPRPLSFLFTSLLFWLLFRWGRRRTTRDLVLLAAAAGLSLAHHTNSLLLFPALGAYLLGRDPRLLLHGRQLLPAALACVLPLALYAYLPIRSAMDPPLGATNLADPRELAIYIAARNYQDTVLVNCAGQELLQARRYLVFLSLQFGPLLPLLGGLGLLLTLVRAPFAGLALLYAFASNAFFGICSRLAMPEYIVPSYVVVAMSIGLGVGWLLRLLEARRRPIDTSEASNGVGANRRGAGCARVEGSWPGVLPALLVLGVLLGASAYRVVTGLPYQDMTGRLGDAERARRGMSQARSDGLILSDWESITPLWYAQRVEGLGQGAKTAMVTASPESPTWLVETQKGLDARPVSLAQRVPSLGETYKLFPVGTLYEVQEKTIVERTANLGLGAEDRAIRLLGFALDRPYVTPGDVVALTLYEGAGRSNKLSLVPRLRLASDPPVDFAFTNALQIPTSSWSNDEVVARVFTFSVPEWLQPGAVGMQLGYVEEGGDTPIALGSNGAWAPIGELTVQPSRGMTLPRPPGSVASFANQFVLRGGRVTTPLGVGDLAQPEPLAARRGARLEVELRWASLRWLDQSYTLFVHLLDRDGRLVAQWDGLPLGGVFHTYKWVPGQTILDWVPLTLPDSLPAGAYALEIGAYHSVTTARLPLLDQWGGSRADAFRWGPIEVR
ncbi:MAG: DUF2723 domain-containing protein [Chloroflexi bacterium]|nr:DUF2723 domain-containing protein [Chloroflexota bacterium]